MLRKRGRSEHTDAFETQGRGTVFGQGSVSMESRGSYSQRKGGIRRLNLGKTGVSYQRISTRCGLKTAMADALKQPAFRGATGRN